MKCHCKAIDLEEWIVGKAFDNMPICYMQWTEPEGNLGKKWKETE